jgi:hypothetical protein
MKKNHTDIFVLVKNYAQNIFFRKNTEGVP